MHSRVWTICRHFDNCEQRWTLLEIVKKVESHEWKFWRHVLAQGTCFADHGILVSLTIWIWILWHDIELSIAAIYLLFTYVLSNCTSSIKCYCPTLPFISPYMHTPYMLKRISLQVSKLELIRNSYSRSNWKFSFLLGDHIDPLHCLNHCTSNVYIWAYSPIVTCVFKCPLLTTSLASKTHRLILLLT
jgi:hypothetical protein